jgi:hypothetical protein
LTVQAASQVNTTTAGQQVFRSIGALADGGYTVAWISDDATLFTQRFDASGLAQGGETGVPLAVEGDPALVAAAIAGSSTAVLSDGSVVVAYTINRVVPDTPVASPTLTKEGVFFQRFDANGVQLQGETEVRSTTLVASNRTPTFRDPKVVALSDGGFVVGGDLSALAEFGGILTSGNELFHQRYDSGSQPVGGIVPEGTFAESAGPGFNLVADANGGYTLSVQHDDLAAPPGGTVGQVVSTFHYDASDNATEIAPPRPGAVLLLPLRGDRFLLFTSDSSGSFGQFLDSAGNPVGQPASIASMPVAATELADGSFVVFSQADGGGFTAQRFDPTGTALGSAVPVDATVSMQGVASLTDGSFALAWSATPAGGDADVFTQRVLVQD